MARLRSRPLRSLLTSSFVFVAGCQLAVENGETISGTPDTKSFTFTGWTPESAGEVHVQVLDSLTTSAKDSSASWTTLDTLTAGTSAYNSGGVDYFGYTDSVSGFTSATWPDGGVARLRLLYGDVSDEQTGFTFDDTSCTGSTSGTFLQRANACKSHDNGYLTLVDIDPLPSASIDFISLRSNTLAEAADYYAAIDPTSAKDTFAKWKFSNGFSPIPFGVTSAVYYNEQDLRFGRNMNCKRSLFSGRVACYVSNYGDASASGGPDVGDPSAPSLAAAVAKDPNGLVATVAMEYYPARTNNEVTFYVFNAAGDRLEEAKLDSEGNKPVPGLCLSCHGGDYDATTDSVTGAKFLPFDLDNFIYSTTSGYTRADQEDDFRALNKIVLDTGPTAAIQEIVDGWYDDGTGTADLSASGPDQDSDFVPAGWSTEETLYLEVIKPYCRTCHMALETRFGSPSSDIDFGEFSDLEFGSGSFGTVQSAVCASFRMPHAEVTQEKFWESPARAHLIGALDLSTACAP